LTGPELDDLKIGEAVDEERILFGMVIPIAFVWA
jgi:hypothetical protein